MQYRKDLKSGNELSVLGLGCMRFPRGLGGRIDKEKTEQIIREAIEGGINYFDTAYVYPGSEVITGEILHKLRLRDKVYIASKLPHVACKKPEDFDRLFSEQLKRLKTDHIDYYLVHNIGEINSWERLRQLGIEQWVANKKAQGQIGQFGFSFHGARDGFMELLESYDWDFCQIQYNYGDENYQAGRAGLERAYEKGIPVIVMEPLLGGKLATGLPKKAVQLFEKANKARSNTEGKAHAQAGKAQGKEATPAAWGLRWVWDQPEVTLLLSGMSSLEQLRENLDTAATAKPGMLSKNEHATIAQVIEIFRAADKVPCTGCHYCMPCAQGVNIPGCFASYNARHVNGLVAGMSSYVMSTAALRSGGGNNSGPSNCTQCGVCEKACPQHIEISRELTAVKKKMEPFWYKPVVALVRKFMS
ncbi:MAG: aldo/keto reductase [Coriobacteriales bacterium]|jgi:predicted aldo/keto reductase-like oxidoreductase|nr:aldo/keto reductase [Coriobacteriales bacterium]